MTAHESYIVRPVKTSFFGNGLFCGCSTGVTAAAAASRRATSSADSLILAAAMAQPML